ncbi:MAG: hypothetical protein JNL95_10405 [Chitinophagales bacterium]|nr:hypothetical protein [Chitinophagales bacterium]
MKKSLTSLLALFVLTGYAQIEKGTIAPAGSVSLSYKANSKTDQKIFDFTLALSEGFFVANNFAIGPTVGYAVNSTKQKSGTTDLTQSFFIGPQLKYYVKIGNKAYVHFFGAMFGNFGSFKQLSDPPNNTALSTRGAIWQLGTGLSIFLHPTIALSISPMYRGDFTQSYIKNKAGIIPGTQSNAITHGFYLNIGFAIYLRKKK